MPLQAVLVSWFLDSELGTHKSSSSSAHGSFFFPFRCAEGKKKKGAAIDLNTRTDLAQCWSGSHFLNRHTLSKLRGTMFSKDAEIKHQICNAPKYRNPAGIIATRFYYLTMCHQTGTQIEKIIIDQWDFQICKNPTYCATENHQVLHEHFLPFILSRRKGLVLRKGLTWRDLLRV